MERLPVTIRLPPVPNTEPWRKRKPATHDKQCRRLGGSKVFTSSRRQPPCHGPTYAHRARRRLPPRRSSG